MTEKKAYVSNAASPRLRLIKYLHLVLSVLLFLAFWLKFRYQSTPIVFDRGFRYNYFVALGYGVLLMWFNGVFNSYTLGYFRIRSLAFSQFLADFFSLVITYFAVSLAWFRLWNPLPLVQPVEPPSLPAAAGPAGHPELRVELLCYQVLL